MKKVSKIEKAGKIQSKKTKKVKNVEKPGKIVKKNRQKSPKISIKPINRFV